MPVNFCEDFIRGIKILGYLEINATLLGMNDITIPIRGV